MASIGQAQNGSVVAQESQNSQVKPGEADPSSGKNEPEVPMEKPKWPGWPGSCVFRLIVPVLKVGSIIGRKGELVKKMCEETGAKIRVLDGPASSPDRVVLISGKEEPNAALSPAMDAVIRVFKRVSGLSEGEDDVNLSGVAGAAFFSIRLLVASSQAVNLIGKQGSLIKPIQKNTGASIRVLSNDEMSIYATSDERIVEIQGEALKVLKALESVIGHLRKFLVDQSVLPLFEKSYNTPAVQEREAEPWSERSMLTSRPGLGDYAPRSGLVDYPPTKRDTLFSERESQLDSHYHSTGLSLYGQDTGLSGTRISGAGRAGNSVIQISQTVQMQIPLAYAEDIIGIGGANIAYIRRTSGAVLTSRRMAEVIGAPAAQVKSIFVYPIKSCRGISVSQAPITSTGFRWDRQWLVVNSKGRAYTQRVEPKLALVEVALPTEAFSEGWEPNNDSYLVIRAPDMAPLKIPLSNPSEVTDGVSVWEWSGSAMDEGAEAAMWFSTHLGKPSRLVRFSEVNEMRVVDPNYAQGYNVMFSDGYPYLVLSQGSLNALNSLLKEPVPVNRFRPNVLVDGCEPFAEDLWKEIRINKLTFEGVKLCSRCKVPTINQETAVAGNNEHVIDISSSNDASSSSNPHDRPVNNVLHDQAEHPPSTSAAVPVSQNAFSSANRSNLRNSSFARRGNGRRHRSPLNSVLWISIELVLTLSQIIAAIAVLAISRDEHPRAPLYQWIVGYASGCVAILPLLYWRFRHRNQNSDQDSSQQPQISSQAELSARSSSSTRSSEGEGRQITGTASTGGQSSGLLSRRLKAFVEYFKMALDCFFAVWFVVGNVWIFGGHSSSSEAPNLYRLCIVFLTISCIGYAMPFILCATICCCLPCIISVMGFREDLTQNKGATPESINALPTYKFKVKKNKSGNKEAAEGGVVAAGTDKERVISGEDAVCCICLVKYVNNDELRELPCCHFFHKDCVDKWLKINNSCPLCKAEVGETLLSSLTEATASLRQSSAF